MQATNKAFLRATLAMIGTIIGAGVFALPVAFKNSGVLTGSAVYWLVALVVLATHLLYAETILRAPSLQRKRLPGQAGEVLGRWAGGLGLASHSLMIFGACLAYLILGGEFLAVLARAVGMTESVLFWQILFWACGAAVIFFGLKLVARVEAPLTWMLVALLLVSVAFYAARADAGLFLKTNWIGSFAPVGVFLFALVGLPVIPEVADLCKHKPRNTRLAVGAGSLVAALVMWLFAVFAASSIGASLLSYTDLPLGLPAQLFWLIPAIGFLAVATSFLTLMQDLKAMLHLDMRFPKPGAWAVSLGVPLMLLLFVTRDFLKTVEFSGLVFSSVNGLLVALMALVLFRRLRKSMGPVWRMIIPCLVAGAFLGMLIWRILLISN